jgi:hypothetical protein
VLVDVVVVVVVVGDGDGDGDELDDASSRHADGQEPICPLFSRIGTLREKRRESPFEHEHEHEHGHEDAHVGQRDPNLFRGRSFHLFATSSDDELRRTSSGDAPFTSSQPLPTTSSDEPLQGTLLSPLRNLFERSVPVEEAASSIKVVGVHIAVAEEPVRARARARARGTGTRTRT